MSRLNEVVTIKGGRAAMEEAREILKEGARRAIEGEPISEQQQRYGVTVRKGELVLTYNDEVLPWQRTLLITGPYPGTITVTMIAPQGLHVDIPDAERGKWIRGDNSKWALLRCATPDCDTVFGGDYTAGFTARDLAEPWQCQRCVNRERRLKREKWEKENQ